MVVCQTHQQALIPMEASQAQRVFNRMVAYQMQQQALQLQHLDRRLTHKALDQYQVCVQLYAQLTLSQNFSKLLTLIHLPKLRLVPFLLVRRRMANFTSQQLLYRHKLESKICVQWMMK